MSKKKKVYTRKSSFRNAAGRVILTPDSITRR